MTAAGDRLYLLVGCNHLSDTPTLIGGELSNAAWFAPDGLFRMQVWLDNEHTKLQHYTVEPNRIMDTYWWDASAESWMDS